MLLMTAADDKFCGSLFFLEENNAWRFCVNCLLADDSHKNAKP